MSLFTTSNQHSLHELARRLVDANISHMELVREINTLGPVFGPAWGPFIDNYRSALNALMLLDAAGVDVVRAMQNAFPEITVTIPPVPTNVDMDAARILTLEFSMHESHTFINSIPIAHLLQPEIIDTIQSESDNDIHCLGRHFRFTVRRNHAGVNITNEMIEDAVRNFKSHSTYFILDGAEPNDDYVSKNDSSANSMYALTSASYVPAILDYDPSELYIEEVTGIVYKNIYYNGNDVELPHTLLFTAFELFVMIKHGIMHDVANLFRGLSWARYEAMRE